MNRAMLALPLTLITLAGPLSAQTKDPNDPFGLFTYQQTMPIDNARGPAFYTPSGGMSFGSPGTPNWTAKDETWGAWNELNFMDKDGGYHDLWCRWSECSKKTGSAYLYKLTRKGANEPYGNQAWRSRFTSQLSAFTLDLASGQAIDPRDGSKHPVSYQSQLTAQGSVINVEPPNGSALDAPDKAPVVVSPNTGTTNGKGGNGGSTGKGGSGNPSTTTPVKKPKKETPKKEVTTTTPVTTIPVASTQTNKTEVTAPVVSNKPLTDFEIRLQGSMKASDDKGHAKAAAECEGKGSPEERAVCWREKLAPMVAAYLKETGTVNEKDPAASFSPIEKTTLNQMMATDPAFKAKYESMLAGIKGPNKAKAFVESMRKHVQGAMTKYQADPPNFDVATYTATAVNALDQAYNAQTESGDVIFDGSNGKTGTDPNAVTVDPKDEKGDKENANNSITSDGKKPKKDKVVPKPEGYGNLTVDKDAGKKDDPTRWNSTMNGVKGAIFGALLGLIFGGPVGMILFATIGFGVAYGMDKINNL